MSSWNKVVKLWNKYCNDAAVAQLPQQQETLELPPIVTLLICQDPNDNSMQQLHLRPKCTSSMMLEYASKMNRQQCQSQVHILCIKQRHLLDHLPTAMLKAHVVIDNFRDRGWDIDQMSIDLLYETWLWNTTMTFVHGPAADRFHWLPAECKKPDAIYASQLIRQTAEALCGRPVPLIQPLPGKRPQILLYNNRPKTGPFLALNFVLFNLLYWYTPPSQLFLINYTNKHHTQVRDSIMPKSRFKASMHIKSISDVRGLTLEHVILLGFNFLRFLQPQETSPEFDLAIATNQLIIIANKDDFIELKASRFLSHGADVYTLKL